MIGIGVGKPGGWDVRKFEIDWGRRLRRSNHSQSVIPTKAFIGKAPNSRPKNSRWGVVCRERPEGAVFRIQESGFRRRRRGFLDGMGTGDHEVDVLAGMDGQEPEAGVGAFKHAEDFVGKGRTDGFHAGEVENHDLEAVDPGQQPLGLGTGNQLFEPLPQQMHGDNGFVEAIIVIGRGKGLENLLAGARAAVGKRHEDGGAGAGFFPLQDPVFFVAILVGEVHLAGQDGEVVEHARGEEDAFARMAFGIGREFAFGEFEHGMALVFQMAGFLDFPEDADAVVAQHNLRADGVSLDMDAQGGAVGMIDGVVDHFARRVFPDSSCVGGEIVEKGGQMLAPNGIFMEPAEGKAERFLPEGRKVIAPLRGSSLRSDQSVGNQFAQEAINRLPRDTELVPCEAGNVMRMRLDVLEDKVDDFFAMLGTTSHGDILSDLGALTENTMPLGSPSVNIVRIYCKYHWRHLDGEYDVICTYRDR